MPDALPHDGKYALLRNELRGIGLTLCLVLGVTVVIFAIIWTTGLTRGTVIYIIPVLVAATRWGIISALVGAIGGVLASAYLFFPPLYTLEIRDPQEVINLLLFIFVAVVVSQLANRLKRQLEISRQREIDVRDLYAFSRRLAVAFDASDIQSAIEDHLATVMQRKVVLFVNARDAAASNGRRGGVAVPGKVLDTVAGFAATGRDKTTGVTVTADNGEVWLVRAISPKSPEHSLIAINFGRESKEGFDELRIRVDAVLADATATLERLGIAHAINEANMRAQTDLLREALIGSVSHELRTPLASIMGAATVLSTAPALKGETKLQALVQDVRTEAERLNDDIQNLLDASRISSDLIKPQVECADPSDIVNSALDRCGRRLTGHSIVCNLPADLPFVQVDPVLVKQALVQIFDNAAKYSKPGSQITIAAHNRDHRLTLSVSDQGAGLSVSELPQIWDRFARGERHAATTSGSGLGLWIANAFIAANGGKMTATSDGPGLGATMTIDLPVTQTAVPLMESDTDE